MESGPAGRIQVANCNFDGWCVNSPLRPNQVGDPGAGDQDGLLWFNPAAFESPAGTRVRNRASRSVPPARPSPVGLHRVQDREPCWYFSSPVQGRPDQRVQSDPVPRRQYRVCCAPRDDDVLQYDRSFWFRKSHEHTAAARDPAWPQIRLVRSIATAMNRLLRFCWMTSLLIGLAASVITQPSLVAVQTAVVQRTSPIPGFRESLEQIRNLLARGRGIEAENVARALLPRVEAASGPDALEVAEVLDLLGAAVRRSSKVKEEEKREFAERSVAIKEQVLGPAHPDLATSLINLGVQRALAGDPAAARPLLERALADSRSRLRSRSHVGRRCAAESRRLTDDAS